MSEFVLPLPVPVPEVPEEDTEFAESLPRLFSAAGFVSKFKQLLIIPGAPIGLGGTIAPAEAAEPPESLAEAAEGRADKISALMTLFGTTRTLERLKSDNWRSLSSLEGRLELFRES